MEHDAYLEARDENFSTALHWAAQGGEIEVTKFLVEHDADLEAQDIDGW